MPPLYVLAPKSAQVPEPILLKVPAAVPIMLAKLLAVAVPLKVKPKPDPVMVPVLEMIMFPLLATMLLELPRVISPL